MGRIKTKLARRVTLEVMNAAPDKITEDFTENKKVVAELLGTKSKKLKNIIAGYTTRLKKAQEEI